jgi:hypothetical protein
MMNVLPQLVTDCPNDCNKGLEGDVVGGRVELDDVRAQLVSTKTCTRPPVFIQSSAKNKPDLCRGENKLGHVLKSKNERNIRLANIYDVGIQVTATSTFLDFVAFV